MKSLLLVVVFVPKKVTFSTWVNILTCLALSFVSRIACPSWIRILLLINNLPMLCFSVT